MNQDTRTHWKKLTDPRFMGVYALPNEGDDLTVEITHVTHEEITMMGGKKEMHTIAHLKGNKPLILNKTNSLSIEKLYSPYIETWAGKLITLYASTTNMGKEKNVPCLRVRPQVMTKKKQFITNERLKRAIDQIKAGSYTEKKLRDAFEITAEQEAMLKQPEEQAA
jgi:hypothetical protein